MTATYRLTANDLTADFLKALRTLYKDRTISITVETEMDETEYLLASPANRKVLEDSLKSEEGYEFSLKEFSKLSENLRKGKKIDFSKISKVKIPK